ncbi:MAG TPA: MBL fold metallo-hydrolase, partial [Candidatus Deferrimicrobiaceae bacterium]
ALLDHLPRSASAVAAEDAQLLEIDHALFVYLVSQQPAFALFVQKALSLRLRGIAAPPGQEDGAGAATVPAGDGKVPGPVALGEGIHLLRGKCNCYLLRGSRKTVLVDTGLPWEKEILAGQLLALGLSPDDIDLVVLTHEHLDHIGAVPLFPRRTVVAAHVLAANKIGMQDDFVLMSKAYRLNAAEYHVDVHLHHGTIIDLGGFSLHVLHSPGHSSGSICLYEPDRELLLTGDTIFANGILGGIFPSGSLSDYAWTLRQLSALRVREIHPGHGRRSENPVDDFEKAIRGSRNLMNDTRALFGVFDSREEFSDVSRGVSTYAKRV